MWEESGRELWRPLRSHCPAPPQNYRDLGSGVPMGPRRTGAPRKCEARNLKGERRPETLTVPWRLPQPGGVRSPRQGPLSLDPSDAPSSCLSLYGRWKF